MANINTDMVVLWLSYYECNECEIVQDKAGSELLTILYILHVAFKDGKLKSADMSNSNSN